MLVPPDHHLNENVRTVFFMGLRPEIRKILEQEIADNKVALRNNDPGGEANIYKF